MFLQSGAALESSEENSRVFDSQSHNQWKQSRVSCLSDITDRLNAFQNRGGRAGQGGETGSDLAQPHTSPPSLAAGKLGGRRHPRGVQAVGTTGTRSCADPGTVELRRWVRPMARLAQARFVLDQVEARWAAAR